MLHLFYHFNPVTLWICSFLFGIGLHCMHFTIYTMSGKGATLFWTTTRISWSIFIIFAAMETGMNTVMVEYL